MPIFSAWDTFLLSTVNTYVCMFQPKHHFRQEAFLILPCLG